MKVKNKVIFNGIIIIIIINLLLISDIVACCVLGWQGVWFALFVTLLMFAYHFDTRAIIGVIFTKFVRPHINVNRKLWSISDKEFARLNRLRVKAWKDRYITIDKSQFVVGFCKNDILIESALKYNISAEIIHWTCFFVGFLSIPIGLVISSSEWYIYVVTAVFASLFCDFLPILIQRYNRYRLNRIYKTK